MSATLPDELVQHASVLVASAVEKGVRIATAESCTGGLISACLTEVPGSSDIFERGFVTYSNEAKMELLAVPEHLLGEHGAVSEQVAGAMAKGALSHSNADLAVAVTGIAGPGGGSAEKPVGLVYIATAAGDDVTVMEFRFGDPGRDMVRLETVREALQMLQKQL